MTKTINWNPPLCSSDMAERRGLKVGELVLAESEGVLTKDCRHAYVQYVSLLL